MSGFNGAVEGGALHGYDVVDNLTNTSTTAPLSANMGKTLNEAIAQSTARMDYFSTDTGIVIRLDATDLNTIKRTGNYYANNNCPNSISGGGYLVVIEYSTTYVKQIMYPYNDERIYTRSLNNGTWSGWTEH